MAGGSPTAPIISIAEEAIALNGAFVVGGTNADRVAENGTVEFSFQMSVFDGVTTPANYDFDSSLVTRDSEIYRISFSAAAVPEPSSVVMLLCGVVLCGFRKRQRCALSQNVLNTNV